MTRMLKMTTDVFARQPCQNITAAKNPKALCAAQSASHTCATVKKEHRSITQRLRRPSFLSPNQLWKQTKIGIQIKMWHTCVIHPAFLGPKRLPTHGQKIAVLIKNAEIMPDKTFVPQHKTALDISARIGVQINKVERMLSGKSLRSKTAAQALEPLCSR